MMTPERLAEAEALFNAMFVIRDRSYREGETLPDRYDEIQLAGARWLSEHDAKLLEKEITKANDYNNNRRLHSTDWQSGYEQVLIQIYRTAAQIRKEAGE